MILWAFMDLMGWNGNFGLKNWKMDEHEPFTSMICNVFLNCKVVIVSSYTQSEKSARRLFENSSPWNAARSGSRRNHRKIMQISTGHCVPAIKYFI